MLVQRHSWVWMVLPPETERVYCAGNDPELPRLLEDIGFEVDEGPLPITASRGARNPDAILVSTDGAATEETVVAAAEALGPDGVLAVPVAGGSAKPPRPVHRLLRALELGMSPFTAVSAGLEARRIERAMRGSGLEVSILPTGDRARARYGIGPGGWLRRRRLPVGSIVKGERGGHRASALEAARAKASEAIGRPLSVRSANVFETGKLGVELVDAGGSAYFLSLAASPASDGLERSTATIRGLLAADVPGAVRERIMEPLADGWLGPVRYVLEPLASGRHPVWMTPRLWDDCLEFLIELHNLPLRARDLELRPSWPDLDSAAEFLAEHSSVRQADLIERIQGEAGQRLRGVPRGGVHGDFWSKNLVVRGGRLRAVLDWEWAGRDGLPLIDLMDLRAQLGLRRSRGLPPGPNFVDILWPLAQTGRDEHVGRFCEAVGVATDAATLEAFAIAYWLLRTARAGSIRPMRLQDDRWVNDNIAAPLAELEPIFGAGRAKRGRQLRPGADDGALGPRRARSQERSTSDIMVLGYHALSRDWPAQLSVTPAQLESQLNLLLDRGYRGVTFSEAVLAPPGELVVAITFDDAYRSTFDLAFPILAERGVPGTVFVPTAFAGRAGPMAWPGIDHWCEGPYEQELIPMSWDQIGTLAQAGWEIGSHSHTHPRLTSLDDASLADELVSSRLECEQRLGLPCRSLAYPYGDHDQRVIAAAREAGYEAACTFSTHLPAPAPLRWPRIGIHRRDYPLRFRLKVSPATRRARASRSWERMGAVRSRAGS